MYLMIWQGFKPNDLPTHTSMIISKHCSTFSSTCSSYCDLAVPCQNNGDK